MNSPAIHVKAGETFEVPLEVTAGTGFRWEVVLPPGATLQVTLLEETRDVPTLTPGSKTVQRFRFRALTAGTLELTFRYRRAWKAADSGDQRVFAVQIDPAA